MGARNIASSDNLSTSLYITEGTMLTDSDYREFVTDKCMLQHVYISTLFIPETEIVGVFQLTF